MKCYYVIILTAILFSIGVNAQIEFQQENLIDGYDEISGARLPLNETLDINNDGWNDIGIIANNKIGWYENLDGSGTYSAFKIISDETGFASVTISDGIFLDFDLDGDLDLIQADQEGVSWFENLDGSGNFGTEIQLFQSPVEVFDIADFDNDGDLDFVTYEQPFSGNRFSWYENLDGNGSYGGSQLILDVGIIGCSEIFFKDINGDTYLDVFAVCTDGIRWIENLEDLGYMEHMVDTVNTTTAVLLDFDNDNDLDVLQTSCFTTETIHWYENLDGAGTFSSAIEIFPVPSIGLPSICAGDFDLDGDYDLITGNYSSEMVLYENIGENIFSLGVPIPNLDDSLTLGNGNLIWSDVNNDNYLDIVTIGFSQLNPHVEVSWRENQNGMGNFDYKKIISERFGNPIKTLFADINSDSKIDMITFDAHYLLYHQGLGGNGNFDRQRILFNGFTELGSEIFFQDFAIGSLSNDSDLDILLFTNEDSLLYFENQNGGGSFDAAVTINSMPSSTSTTHIQVVDIDGDNLNDILYRVRYNLDNYSKIFWHRNLDGGGTFSGPIEIGDNFNILYDFKVVDLNNDGALDILFMGKIDDRFLGWYENDNTGGFSSYEMIYSWAVGGNYRQLEYADIDEDGIKDIIVIRNDQLYWLKSSLAGENFSYEGLLLDVEISDFTFSINDLNADLKNDIYITSKINSEMSYFLKEGIGTNFSEKTIITDNAFGLIHIEPTDLDSNFLVDIPYWHRTNENVGLLSDFGWFRNLGSTENEIFGLLSFDIDNNGCTISNLPLGNRMVTTSDGSTDYATFSQPNGSYSFSVHQGVFTTELGNSLPFYLNSNPNEHISEFLDTGISEELPFCIQPTEAITDIAVTIYPLNDAQPGFEAHYQIIFENSGTTFESGNVSLDFNGESMDFISSSETVTSQTSNNISFSYMDLAPFETRIIDITFSVEQPPIVTIGDVLDFTATVNPIADDNNQEDNIFEMAQTVVGSFDPNDIQVLEGEFITNNQIDAFLHYIIRFQNTGTAPAINIRVTNQIHSNLDWTTMQLENVSHPNRVEITNGSEVEFIFENINLPDSTSNEAESHGFIQYKIKPRNTIEVGEFIGNTADIYFDFNLPITTNTVTTTVIEEIDVTANQPLDLIACEEFPNAVFDLTVTEPEILGSQDSTNHDITFYLTQQDAEDGTSPIVNETAYTGTTNETIYARITRVSDGEYNVTNFTLLVGILPKVFSIQDFVLIDEGNDGVEQFDLTQKISEITANEPGLEVLFYETEADAEVEMNQIPNPTSYPNLSDPQTIYVRIVENDYGCYSINSFIIRLTLEVIANQPNDLIVCGGTPDTIFDLTITEPEILGSQDPANHIISFHLTQLDADNGTNPIANPSVYSGTDGETIFARITRQSDNEYDTINFTLLVGLLPQVFPIEDFGLIDEGNDGVEEFDLTQKIAEITAGEPGLEVFFYETESDAESDENRIQNPESYTNLTDPQTIYVRIVEGMYSCSSINSFIIFLEAEMGFEDVELDEIALYPNPVDNNLNIISVQPITRARIFNLLGQIVVSESDATGIQVVSVAKLNSGIYFIELELATKQKVVKRLIRK